ncbi:MAG: hypothetical protein R6U95_10775 [Bacteroidales bacterium]
MDPVDQVNMSNYSCLANNPILYDDPLGLKPDISINKIINKIKQLLGFQRYDYPKVKMGTNRRTVQFRFKKEGENDNYVAQDQNQTALRSNATGNNLETSIPADPNDPTSVSLNDYRSYYGDQLQNVRLNQFRTNMPPPYSITTLTQNGNNISLTNGNFNGALQISNPNLIGLSVITALQNQEVELPKNIYHSYLVRANVRTPSKYEYYQYEKQVGSNRIRVDVQVPMFRLGGRPIWAGGRFFIPKRYRKGNGWKLRNGGATVRH